MHSAYLIVTILTAAANIYAASCDFTRPGWILANMKKMGVQERWLPTLGILKALGGVGLLVGIGIPQIGLAAAAGLVLFFIGAMVTAMRARYYAHLPVPLVWLVLAAGSLALCLRSA
ncbi:MAG: DoxX family protein [Candidatus Micrarchaeaceae archaeon]